MKGPQSKTSEQIRERLLEIEANFFSQSDIGKKLATAAHSRCGSDKLLKALCKQLKRLIDQQVPDSL